jgi:D-3-phosphoglycerate dehydrogenase / 2-oxoglutarate reductase
MKVLVLDKLSPEAREIFSRRGLEFEERLDLKGAELRNAVRECDALIIRSSSQIDQSLLADSKRLKVVGRAGIGLDNVDVRAATRHGIIVMNTPSASTTTTAELAVAMLMALSRNIAQADASMKRGEWNRQAFVGREIYGKQAGIIGLGRIGLGVALRLQKLGMKVSAYDPFVSREVAARYEVPLLELDPLLATSDYVSLHAALTDKTRQLLGTREFGVLQPGAMIINCARGDLIDEKALLEALESGRVAGAALDVFQKEPPEKNHPLISHPRVIATPHLGASTVEAQTKVAVEIAEQVADALLGGEVRNAVNLPSVDVQAANKARKFIQLTSIISDAVGQIARGRPRRIELEYGGLPEELPRGMLMSTAITAVLRRFLETGVVNNVNAALVAEERGIEVRETRCPASAPFTNHIRVSLSTDEGLRSIAGTVFPHGVLRWVEMDGFMLEASPSPFMLVSTNLDLPGVVGKLGTLLGQNRINIAGMQLGRLQGGEKAVSILNVDSNIPEDVLDAIRALPEILETTLVRLGEV